MRVVTGHGVRGVVFEMGVEREAAQGHLAYLSPVTRVIEYRTRARSDESIYSVFVSCMYICPVDYFLQELTGGNLYAEKEGYREISTSSVDAAQGTAAVVVFRALPLGQHRTLASKVRSALFCSIFFVVVSCRSSRMIAAVPVAGMPFCAVSCRGARSKPVAVVQALR